MILLTINILIGYSVTAADILIPGQPPLRHIRHGDIDIGGIISGLNYSPEGLCGDSQFMDASYHFAESVAHAVDRINRNASILADVRLGFVILDDCMKQATAAVQAMAFLERDVFEYPTRGEYRDHGTTLETHAIEAYESIKFNESNACFKINSTERGGIGTARANKPFSKTQLKAYDVVGVIGCLRSSNSMMAAQILGAGQIPMVSFISTSPKLSNREMYPYFFRVVPSDDFLVSTSRKITGCRLKIYSLYMFAG